MSLAPPAVIDAVVVVAGAGYSRLIEVGVGEDGCRGHESAAGVAVYSDLVDVHVSALCRQLLKDVFVVSHRIVAHVTVTEVVIPFRAVGMPSPVAYGHDYEAQLGQTVDAVHPRCPEIFGGLYLRSGIDVFYDGVELGGVKVKRLVDDTPEVGDAVGGFGLEYLGELVTGHEQLAEITGLP